MKTADVQIIQRLNEIYDAQAGGLASSFAAITGDPSDNTALDTALNTKQTGAQVQALIDTQNLSVNAADDLATGGDGSVGTPWTGWDTALAALSGSVDVYFPAGVYNAIGEIVTSTAGAPKSKWYLHGAGIGATIIQFNTTGNGISNKYAANTSTAARFVLEHMTLTNSHASATGAGFDQVGGTFVTLNHVVIIGWKYGVIFDQTELADILSCDFEGQLTGGAGVWIVNGADHTVGNNPGFTNRISIERSQFNQVTGVDHLIDDGGVTHSFKNNNFNGGTTAIRIAGVNGLSLSRNSIEGCAGNGIEFATTTSVLGTAVGTSSNAVVEIPPSVPIVNRDKVTGIFTEGSEGLTVLELTDAANAVDEKRWVWQTGTAVGAGVMRLRAINDASGFGLNALIFTRTGISSIITTFPGDVLSDGNIKGQSFISTGAATTCTGATIGTGSKSNAGFVTATTTGVSTIEITFPATAPTGWNVFATDRNSEILIPQTASSTTTATIAGTTTSGNVISYIAMAY